MMRFIGLAIVGILSASGAAKAVVSLDAMQRQDAQVQAVTQSVKAENATLAGATATSSAAAVVKAADGHYWAQADVNGRAVRFMVDTGATNVVLTAADAQRLGLAPKDLTYDRPVMTADGETHAAAVVLDRVSVAGAHVEKVAALVMAEGLDTSLLGMSYLGRLSRFEATPTALILRP